MQNKLQKTIETNLTKSVAEKIGQACVDLMIDRIMSRKDVNGKDFPDYSPAYKKWKAKFLGISKGKTRKFSGKQSQTMLRLLNRRTKYKANAVDDKVRLTGQLLSGIKYKVIGVSKSKMFINAKIRLFLDKKQEAKAEGLTKRGYDFFGMSRAGDRKRYEEQVINDIIIKASKGKLQ